MAFGITPQGFVIKRLEDILQGIGDKQRAAFGALLDTATETELGQLNGTFASGLAECWELLEACYHGFDPDAAADYLLTVLAALTGTERRAAKKSEAELTLNLDDGVTVPAGSLVAHSARPDIIFETLVDVTNSSGITDDFQVDAECTQTGPTVAGNGTLTVIVNAIGGWNSVTNAEDADVGRNIDNDIILRQRREDQLALRGGSTLAAIKADLLDVSSNEALSDMRSVAVLENTDDVTVDSLPPHSFEVLIDDGDTPTIDNDLIAQIIWDGKPAGIATYGSESGTAIDDNGDSQIVNFSRVTLRPVYIDVALTTTADFPVGGADLVKEAIVASGADYGIADLVIALHLRSAALTVTGVVDVPTFELAFTPSPATTSNLDPGIRARATFSTTNITIL
jgi:hypothetical protein